MTEDRIAAVRGRRVWDSRGRPTVEAEILTAGGAAARAIAPAGASTGSGEALDKRDGGNRLGGWDVQGAVGAINEIIGPAIVGMDASEQRAIDETMLSLDGTAGKAHLGGNATIAVSLAVSHAAAAARDLPLWLHLRNLENASGPVLMPLPEIQIFGGGAHANARIDMQDVMVMPVGAPNFAEAMAWTAEVYRAAGARMAKTGRMQGVADEGGWWPAFQTNEEALAETVAAIEDAGLTPGRDMAISLDIAATQLLEDGRYRLALEDRVLERDAFVEMLAGWCDAYPIASVEDPVAEDDLDGAAAFAEAVAGRVQVIGDDLLVTNADRVAAARKTGACSALLVKPNQAGTLTETRAAFDAARDAGWATIVSARSGETEDVSIVHLSVGWSAGQLKVGSFARSERMAKWNEAIRVEETAGPAARYAGREALVFPRES